MPLYPDSVRSLIIMNHLQKYLVLKTDLFNCYNHHHFLSVSIIMRYFIYFQTICMILSITCFYVPCFSLSPMYLQSPTDLLLVFFFSPNGAHFCFYSCHMYFIKLSIPLLYSHLRSLLTCYAHLCVCVMY